MHPELQLEAEWELGRRLASGMPAHLLLLVLVAATTPLLLDPASAFKVLGGVLGLVTCVRWFLSRRQYRWYSHRRQAWKRWFSVLLVAAAGCWALIAADAIRLYGLHHYATMIALLVVAGIAAGATTSLSPEQKYARMFISVILGVPAAYLFWRGSREESSVGAIMVTYLGYLWIQSGIQCREYRKNSDSARQLIYAREEAAIESSRLKSEFLANVSHEIRTPLNGIIGVADLLLDQELSVDGRKYARIIQDSGNHLLMLLNDVLDFSKIESGKIELEETEFSVAEVVATQAELLAPRAHQKGLELKVSVDPSIPRVRGDSGRIAQVLLNLVANAIKFTDQGEIHVEATLTSGGIAGRRVLLEFSVTDSGIGIPPRIQSRLFQPFTQADSSTARRYGGTGLGLSICKRLVQIMGGEIGVQSQEGEGARFWFTLSLALASEKAPSPEEVDRLVEMAAGGNPTPVTPPSTRSLRVLVAEDNSVNQMLLIAMLGKLGYGARAVSNGREVIEAVASGAYDLILMDCQMPDMDGVEAARRIREREQSVPGSRRVPIVAITANALQEDEVRCREAGMDAFLTKPVNRDRLSATLARWSG